MKKRIQMLEAQQRDLLDKVKNTAFWCANTADDIGRYDHALKHRLIVMSNNSKDLIDQIEIAEFEWRQSLRKQNA